MKRQYIIAIVITAAVLFLAGAGILAYGLSQCHLPYQQHRKEQY